MNPEESVLKNIKNTNPEESKFFVSETTNGETAPLQDNKFFISEDEKKEAAAQDEQDIIDITASIKRGYEDAAVTDSQEVEEKNGSKFFVSEKSAPKNTLAAKLKKWLKF